MDYLAASLGVLAVATSGLVVVELHDRKRRHRLAHTAEIRFGRDSSPASVVAVLDLLGSRRGGPLTFDLLASHGSTRPFVTGDRAALDHLRAALGAPLPGVRLLPAKPPATGSWAHGRTVSLRGRLRTLRDDLEAHSASGLLASLQPLGREERLLVRWTIKPARAAQVPRVEQGVAVEPEDRRRLRAKNAGGLVAAAGLVAVDAHDARRAQHAVRADRGGDRRGGPGHSDPLAGGGNQPSAMRWRLRMAGGGRAERRQRGVRGAGTTTAPILGAVVCTSFKWCG